MERVKGTAPRCERIDLTDTFFSAIGDMGRIAGPMFAHSHGQGAGSVHRVPAAATNSQNTEDSC